MALAGALLITPDTLLIRLSGLESWGLTFWRGLLIGSSLMFLWLVTEGRNAASQIPCLLTIPAVCILLASYQQHTCLQFRDHRDIDYRCSDSFGDGPCSCSRVELFDPARGRTHADMVCDCLYHAWRIHRDFPW
jgi:hypothetical protein